LTMTCGPFVIIPYIKYYKTLPSIPILTCRHPLRLRISLCKISARSPPSSLREIQPGQPPSCSNPANPPPPCARIRPGRRRTLSTHPARPHRPPSLCPTSASPPSLCPTSASPPSAAPSSTRPQPGAPPLKRAHLARPPPVAPPCTDLGQASAAAAIPRDGSSLPSHSRQRDSKLWRVWVTRWVPVTYAGGWYACRWVGYEQTHLCPYPNPLLSYPFLPSP
jgi:hypothetical protein